MSTKLTAWVWDGCSATGMKLSSVAIMARLADFSSDEGACWPSIATIARQLGAGQSTVRAAIRKLEEDGWLTTTKRRKGNRNTSNMYQLNISKLRRAAYESHPPESDASNSDASNFDASDFDASKKEHNGSFDPPESVDDPSVNSKHDPSDIKPFCQVAEQPDPESEIHRLACFVLTHLNTVTDSRYRPTNSTLSGIKARLGEGNTLDDLIQTVDYLKAKWGNDLKMVEYLRPVTMFQPSKFPGYLSGARKWIQAGRPESKDGVWIRQDGKPLQGDNTERDGAYRRFIGSANPIKHPSDLELEVRKEASRMGLKSQKAEFAVSRWNGLWRDLSERFKGAEQ